MRRNQVASSGETASCACVRALPRNTPRRKRLQFEHPQFHWGNPPPAAEPRTLTFIQRLKFGVRVGADFAVQVDFFMLRCNPFHRHPLLTIRLGPGRYAGRQRRKYSTASPHPINVFEGSVGNFGKPRLSNTISISRVETPPRSDASGTPELAMQVVDQDSILPLMGRTPPTGGSGDIGSIRSMATHPASARVPAWSWPLDDPG